MLLSLESNHYKHLAYGFMSFSFVFFLMTTDSHSRYYASFRDREIEYHIQNSLSLNNTLSFYVTEMAHY